MKTLTGVLSAVMLLAGNAQAADKAPAAEPEFKTVTVDGETVVKNGDEKCTHAKQVLFDSLRRSAVEQVVGTYVSSFSETQNYTMLQDVVLASTSGYSRNEKWLKQECGESTFTGTLQAEVGKGQIDKDAAAITSLINAKRQKRIYVIVNDVGIETTGEAKGGGSGASYTARHGMFDAMLREQLRADGFFTLDPNLVDGKLKLRSAIQGLNTPADAAELGNAVGADLVIYGNAVVTKPEPAFNLPGAFSATARASLTCVAPNGAEIIADDAFTQTGSSTNEHEAGSDALKKAAKRAIAGTTLTDKGEPPRPIPGLRAKIYEAWRKSMSGVGQRLVLTVTNVKEYKTLTVFKELLSSSVANVKGVSSSRLDNGTASLDVSYLGNSDGFAGDLDGKSVNGHAISVTKVTPNTVEISLK